MDKGIKNSKSQSIFSNSGKAFIMAGGLIISALPAVQAHESSQAKQHDDAGASMSMMKHEGMSMAGKDMSMGSKDMHESMMKGMKGMGSMPMTGDTDQDFAMMMKKHHQAAIDMAKIELKHGKDAELKDMAQKILDSQQTEIKQFEQWQKEHKSSMSQSMPKSQ